jgi:hypothetical protein
VASVKRALVLSGRNGRGEESLGRREEESVAAHSLDAVDPAALAARLPSDDAALFAPPAPRLATQIRSLGHALSGLSRGAARQAASLAARSVPGSPRHAGLGSAWDADKAEGAAAGAGEGGGASRGMRRLRGVARTVAAVRRAGLGLAARAAAAPEEAAGEEVAMSEEAMLRVQEAEAAARAAASAAQARVESAAAELEIKRTVPPPPSLPY